MATKYPKAAFCGGVEGDEAITNVVQFDGKRWAALPPMNVPRSGAAAVYYNGT